MSQASTPTEPSPQLGTHWPVPVEVIPFGWSSQARFLEALGATYMIRKGQDGAQFVTDSGNMILDCHSRSVFDKLIQATLLNFDNRKEGHRTCLCYHEASLSQPRYERREG